MEVCKEELCESNEIHEDLLKIVDETLPEETELYDCLLYTSPSPRD